MEIVVYKSWLTGETKHITDHPIININRYFDQTPWVSTDSCLDMCASLMSAG